MDHKYVNKCLPQLAAGAFIRKKFLPHECFLHARLFPKVLYTTIDISGNALTTFVLYVGLGRIDPGNENVS